ncbi:dimethyl sulfoxide reductase anchor subunit [Blastopirellula sp. JC732]|uniref:Dimethyl sulfoxide reductase anchor subunit n=1 Tax=Blastopirellula sediminis TaxID=2894196 RepID=A0A9X1MI86_9BACT|nr:DmsC/YnfH family molybdoenzyme membrane anchor subunit [Blastopirellula sediminis]MCC9608161.1 dimethyl sulfoxide reductase anchor subunit [Blastopirellula sediminis]MCC9627046.1 dimethyl sulfoxide reductase anchor subunit [Blastopirellula sediminis]
MASVVQPKSPVLTEGFDLVQFLLEEQQDLTAVERFSQRHADISSPLMAPMYRELLPAEAPRPGEQYAFEVDLDACSGCKACVVACHNRNGLEPEETWRSVGLLQGEGECATVQHVTTACHHCADPGCLRGCPVRAYEKDPVTGIVVHLDDQCIGCKYCTMMCPYDVPQYSEAKGIVRKCDMCRQRLDVGEAPACVQACPNQAIRITLVRQDEARTAGANGEFLDGAAHPSTTNPTTQFVGSTRKIKLASGDQFSIRQNHGHLPLVALLVFTQLSVGAALAGCLWEAHRLALFLIATGFCAIGLAASGAHLGRPFYGYRVFLGLRTSWLSREAIIFGKYFPAIALATASFWFQMYTPIGLLLGWAGVAVGLLGVFCSIMIYVATRRPVWGPIWTGERFGGTVVLLGAAAAMAADSGERLLVVPIAIAVIALTATRALLEYRFAAKADDDFANPFTRTKYLQSHSLLALVRARNVLWGLGGVLFPIAWMLENHQVPSIIIAATGFLLLTGAELLDRFVYFASESTPSMPGVARSGEHG